jgi:hypothetical protein
MSYPGTAQHDDLRDDLAHKRGHFATAPLDLDHGRHGLCHPQVGRTLPVCYVLLVLTLYQHMDRTRRLHRLYPTVWRLGFLHLRLRFLRYLQSSPRC